MSSPSNLKQAIEDSFSNGFLKNALFLAELLYSRDKSEEALRLLGQAYVRVGRTKAALQILRGGREPMTRYHMAMCCKEEKLWAEAVRVLTNGEESALHRVPNGEYGLTLLGDTYRVLQQERKAVACYQAALRINPYMWVAYSSLCAMGEGAAGEEFFSKPEGNASFDDSSIIASPIVGQATPLAFPSFSMTPGGAVPGSPATPMFQAPLEPARQLHLSSPRATGWLACLRHMAIIQWHLSQFRCAEALKLTYQGGLPESGWLWAQRGRALSEMGRYQESCKAFERARRIEPYRMEGMETFSTVLWHLGLDAKLSHLAHELSELDRLAPQTWCAVGNCFSLQQEHDVALRFFRRAIQLDSRFTYAYTLSGHEYVANEDLEQAASLFRTALQLDTRHYNAWYGLGMIFFRTQKLDLASYHFERALAINPSSSALHAYQGMVLSKQQKYPEALQRLERAVQINPRNVLARSKQAQVMIYQGRPEDALRVVDELLRTCPTEAFLHFLRGTIFRTMGDRESAVAAFTEALDRDTKNAALIKTQLERIYTGSSSFLEGEEEDLEEDLMNYEL